MYEAAIERLTKRIGPKKAALCNQLLKYFAVAGCGFVVDFSVLVVLHELFGVYHILAAAAGFMAGLVVNFIFSTRFVFKDSKLGSRWAEFAAFGVIGVVGLGILSVLMWLLTDVLHMYYVLSKILATVVVYMWNFFGRKALYRS